MAPTQQVKKVDAGQRRMSRALLSRVAAAAWLTLAAHCCFGDTKEDSASHVVGGKLIFVDGQPLIQPMNAHGDIKISLLVQNVGSNAALAKFCIVIASPGASPCPTNVTFTDIEASRKAIGAGQFRPISLRISSVEAPIAGYLVLYTSEGPERAVATGFRQLKITAASFSACSWWPIIAGLLCATTVCIVSAAKLRREKVPLDTPMGSPTWDFTKSWASNLTVAGAFLSIAIAIAVLPDQTRYMSKGGYSILNVLLTLLAGLGPFLYNVSRTRIQRESAQDAEYQGTVVAFLIASGVTVWAVVGQLVTDVLVFNELLLADLAPLLLIRSFEVLLLVLIVIIAAFSARSVYWTAMDQHSQRKKSLSDIAAAKSADWSGVLRVPAITDDTRDFPHLREWAVL